MGRVYHRGGGFERVIILGIRKMKLVKGLVAGILLPLFLGTGAMAADYEPPQTPSAETAALFFGGDIRQRSYFGYAGFVFAPFGDLSQDGFLLRGVVGGGEYEYDNAGVPGGEVDGDHVTFDGMLGYQMFFDTVRASVFAGVNVQDHDFSPNDPGNSTRGTEVGFSAVGHLETVASSPFYADLQGSYSTANDTYWARGRVGLRWEQFVIGPEGLVSGNDEYDAQRIGGFVMMYLDMFTFSVSGGYADVDGSQGDDSAYGAFSVGVAF